MRIKKFNEDLDDQNSKLESGDLEIDEIINSIHTNEEKFGPENYGVLYCYGDRTELLEIATTLPRALNIKYHFQKERGYSDDEISVIKFLDSKDLIKKEINEIDYHNLPKRK